MPEPEDTAEGGAERDASRRGSLTAFLTSGPALIGAFAALITAITGLIVGLNQIGVIGGDDDDSGSETEAADTTTTTGAAAYFSPTTSPLGRLYFDGETMLVTATTPNRPLVRPADLEEPLGDVRMSVRARWVSGARSYGAGLICRYENANNYYLLAVFSGGGFNVVRYRNGKPTSLARGGPEGGESDDDDEVEARCVGSDPTNLTLIVDGDEVATVQDPDGIESGVIGVRVGTDEARVTVGFDEFVLRSL